MEIIHQQPQIFQLPPRHEQLELFERRLPKNPYCTDTFRNGVQIRSAATATRRRYIQVNPPWLRSWVVLDLDYNDSALAWESAHLPEPAWSSMNPLNGHSHMAWSLDAPVLLGSHDRQKPMRYLAGIENAMRVQLRADPGYSGLITKNPLHPHWKTLWGRYSYTLDYLAEFLDLDRHAVKRKPETVGLGRNCATFDHVRLYAYREIKSWKQATGRGAYVYWLKHLYDRAQNYTHNEHPLPLDNRESHHIAKSVANWVWNRFDIAASDERFSRLQAHRGRIGGTAKGTANADKRAAALRLRAEGMSYHAIASALGVSRRVVIYWCK